MFNFSKKTKNAEETIEDEFFGKLSFVQASEYEPSHLFGAKAFHPVNSVVECQFYNDKKNITQAHGSGSLQLKIDMIT
jgi:hypothetical protein